MVSKYTYWKKHVSWHNEDYGTGRVIGQQVTNHSLKAYGVTKAFQCQVPEKLSMERSGHRSLQGLRQYERTTDSQEMQVCQILDSTKREYGMPSMVQEVSHCWPLSQQTSSAPTFSGCSCTNCTFQIACLHSRRLLQRTSLTWTLLTSFTFNSLCIHCTLCCCFAFLTLYSSSWASKGSVNWWGRCLFLLPGDNQMVRSSKRC